MIISPDFCFPFQVNFTPTSTGLQSATLTISSNDPANPSVDVPASGTGGESVATTIGELNFVDTCKGDSNTQTVQVCNTGSCNLTVTDVDLVAGMGGNCDDLTIVNEPTTPLTISPDFCFDFNVKYKPDDSTPPTNCSLVITTDDPVTPLITIPITASVGEPNIVLDPPNLDGIYAFPATAAEPGGLGCFSDKMLVIRNNGTCPLVISGISATSPFSVIAPTLFDIILPPGEETLKVTVRFDPTSGVGLNTSPSQVTGTLTVMSNDPQGDATGGLCGEPVDQSGVHELVVNAFDIPISNVDMLSLQSKGINTPSPINIMQMNVPLASSMVCNKTVQYHLDREELPTTETTGSNPRSSYITKAKDGNKQASKSFKLGQCEFKEFILKLK